MLAVIAALTLWAYQPAVAPNDSRRAGPRRQHQWQLVGKALECGRARSLPKRNRRCWR